MGFSQMAMMFIEFLTQYALEPLKFILFGLFVLAFVLRFLVFYTVSRQHWFAVEVSKRVDRFINDQTQTSITSFYIILKKVLEKTYYESFKLRGIMMRRKHDYVTSIVDRLFVIEGGCAHVVKDSLKQTRHLRHGGDHPKMLAISKSVMEGNPSFNKILGIVPASPVNDFLSILPGLFIVGGILGTFLGIMSALPTLGGMNLEDTEAAKKILDGFLYRVAESMGASVLGIFFSVGLTIWNTFLNPERKFVDSVNRFENSLDILWNRSSDNVIPAGLPKFDEHKDPLAAVSEMKEGPNVSQEKESETVE